MPTVTSADGTRIAYDRSGEGRPLILVSGASTDRRANADLAGLLAERFTVVNYDRRGRGDSGDTKPYAVEREFDDLRAVVDDLGGGPVGLWGSSSGAALALLATAAGLPVRRLAMWEPPYVTDDTARDGQKTYRERVTALIEQDRRSEAAELFMQLVGLPQPMIDQFKQSPMWAGMERIAPSLPYDAAVMDDARVPVEAAGRVAVPTLVLTGDARPELFGAAATALVAALPDGRHEVLAGQDHNADAKALAAALVPFFEED
jgi:pimeloyl-ACP methyl ester carboxylesterase